MTSTDESTRVSVEADAELARETFRLLTGSAAVQLPRHRHDLSRDDVRRAQTSRILAAAIELFAERGYADTAIAQIADRAGVSRRTVYDLYDSKEAVFLHTYHCTELLMQEAAGLATRDDTATLTLDSLADAVTRLATLVASAPAAARMYFLEALGAGPRVRERRNEAIANFVAVLAPQLQRLRAGIDPTLPPLTFQLCNAVVAAAIELVVQHIVRDSPETVTAVADPVAQLIRAVVTAS